MIRVVCARCGSSNPAADRFCQTCGRPLGRTCPGCGRDTPAGARFCGRCGADLGPGADSNALAGAPLRAPRHVAERILGGRGSLEGERKQVTALFAEVMESGDVAEAVETETLRGMRDRKPPKAALVLIDCAGSLSYRC